ncbi:hypothetical protein JCM3775_003476 [Rhodotorula graminis]
MSNNRPPSARSASSTPPEPFLLSILHHLLSPFPSPLPPALLSQTSRQAIHYLSISADDEVYWTCGRKDDQVALRRQELVEAGNLDDLVLSHPRFAFDLDETKALISLSLPHSASSRSLGVVLVWEDSTSPLAAATGGVTAGLERKPDEDDIRPGWTFLELQQVDEAALGTSQRHWHPSLAEAVETTTSSLVDKAAPGRADSSPSAAARDEENRARFAEAAGASDCEGTTPGGIGSANDFWSGWSDDEGDSAGKVVLNGGGGGGGGAHGEDDADDDYWSSYGAVDSQVGSEAADDEDDERGRVEERAGSSLGAGARAHRSATITPATAGLAAASLPSSPSTEQQEQQLSSSSAELPSSPAHRDLPPPPPAADTAHSSPFSVSQYLSTPSPRTLAYPSSPSTLRPSTPPPRAPSHERSRPAAAAAAAAPVKSPQRPSHTRKPSDVTKALPSFPAFPVLPRTKSNSTLTPGMMYPGSAPTSPKVGNGRPAPPAASTTDKSLPPAPSAAPSAQQLYVHHRPETFAPQYAHLIPVGREATARIAGAHEVQQPSSAPQGSLKAPLPPSAKFPESPSSSSAASFVTGASPMQHAPEYEHGQAQPSFLAEPHDDDADDAEERGRLDRLASVGSLDGGLSIASTSLTSMLLGRRFSTSTGLEGYGEQGEEGSASAAGTARHFPLPPSHSGASASGDEHEGAATGSLGGSRSGEAESLRFAMAGLWGLFASGARTPAERAERHRVWERVAAEVPRS